MASTDATPSSTTTIGAEETVAWEHAKDLPFVGTDASFADKSGFKSSLENSTSGEPFNKSMMKSKAFGQSKPFEGDLLANIEESELDDMFAIGGITQQHSTTCEKLSSSLPEKDNGQAPKDNSSSLKSNNSSMHATITSIQLDAPVSKELSTFKLNAEDSEDTKIPSLSSTVLLNIDSSMESKCILSPQRQTSEELLQVLNNIETSYPLNNDNIKENETSKDNHSSNSESSNNHVDAKKITIKSEADSVSTAEMENTNEKQQLSVEDNLSTAKMNGNAKPLRRKSLGGKDKKEEDLRKAFIPSTKPSLHHNAKSAPSKSSDAAVSPKLQLTAEKMADAAEAVALTAMKSHAVALINKTSFVDNTKKSHVSIASSAIESDAEPAEAQDAQGTKRKYSSSSKAHKSSLPHVQKRETLRKKEETPNSVDSNATVYGSEFEDDASSLTSDNLNSKSKSSIAKRKPFLPDIYKENANVLPTKSEVLNKKKELMQQNTRKPPPKDPSRIKLPPIVPRNDAQDAARDGNYSFMSQETPGRAARSVGGGLNRNSNNTRVTYSSPPFDRNTNNDGNNEPHVTPSINISTKKRRKPLFLRMIAKADKMLREEERKKQENYNRLRALRPKNTPSRAELKEHAHKFEEFMKSKAELSRQSHIAQIRELKEQHRQYHQKQKDDDGNSVASLTEGIAAEETSLDRESINQHRTPVKGAANAKLQKELEGFDYSTHGLGEQKKERNGQYKGLLKKAGLALALGDDTDDKNSTEKSSHHNHHAFEVTPPKKPKVKATVSMHVVTIGNEAEIIPSPRNNAYGHNIVSNNVIDNALYPHWEPHYDPNHHLHAHPQPHFPSHQSPSPKKPTPRKSTPHRMLRAMDDEEDEKNNDDNSNNNLPSFALVDVLDEEVMQVLNHHRHAGEAGNGENGDGNDDAEEGEERMEAISLADYIPALNEQPLPETVKVQEGFFDAVLSSHNTQGLDSDNILKVIISHDDFDCDDNTVSRKDTRALTAMTVALEEENVEAGLRADESFALSRDPTVENLHSKADVAAVGVNNDDVNVAVKSKEKEEVEAVVNVPDLSEKEVAYFVANDWIDMLANTSMMSDENEY